MEDGISLIIPVFNEEKTLEIIIERCYNQPVVKQLIIVNDGSQDKTRFILNKIRKSYLSSKTILTRLDKPLITITHHKKNLGKGEALKTGLTKALGKYIMVQDADLEYYPEEIIKLFKRAEKSKYGIVFGNRSQNKQKSYVLAQIGNWYLNLMFYILFGLQLEDSYTCYKLMPRKIWQEINLKSTSFEIDAELVSKLGKKGYQIIEVPISYHPRKYSEGKKINWVDVIKATAVALKIRFSNKLYE